jgi:hypothetical protein
MPSRSLHLKLAACVLVACVDASSGCAASRPRGEASDPAIPTVASIPVAPIEPQTAPTASVPPVESPAPAQPGTPAASAPASIAATPESPPADEPPAAAERAATPPETPPRVVIVDELPHRRGRAGRGTGPTPGQRDPVERSHASGRRHGRGARPFHPAPGITVDVAEAHGGTSASELERAARSSAYWPLRQCYEEGLRRDQSLAGRVSLDLDVAATGAVDHDAIASATVRDEAVVLCVRRQASRLVFAAAPSPTHARVEVTLTAGDEPVSAPRAVLHATELRAALRASWPAVEQCYAAGLAKHPDAGGDLELSFRARSMGDVVEVSESGDPRFPDIDVTRCVLAVYRTARLPATRTGTSRETSFAYDLHLEATR